MKSNIAAISLVLGSFTLCCNAYAENPDKIVTVSGQCTVEVTPDRGSVTFVISHTEKDVKQAISKSTELHEKVREEFKRQKIKDLEVSTSEYSVFEKKEWEKDRQVSKGFSSRIGIRATTSEISKLGDLVAIAARLGVKETGALATYLSEQKSLDEKKKCLEVAAKNAREKAEALTKSLNVKLGRAVRIIEQGGNFTPPPQPMYEARMMKTASNSDAAPSIDGQKQTLNQQVDVSFAIE